MKVGFVLLTAALAVTGCKKDTSTSTGPVSGGGGGSGSTPPPKGGGWLVGADGKMANIHTDDSVSGYDTGTLDRLNGIACRNQGEAWVVGAAGKVMYTNDGGVTWTTQAVPTTADLRTLATQDDGPVFVAGNGTFLESDDAGVTWRELSNGQTNFRSVAAATDSDSVYAISDDGTLWTFDGARISPSRQFAGARTVSVSTDGQVAIIAGSAGMWRSTDRGTTWQALNVQAGLSFDDVRLAGDDSAIAVGAGGAIAMVTTTGQVIAQHVATADFHTVRVGGTGWGDAVSYAAGEDGQIWESRDAGWTWTQGPNVGGPVLGIDAIGEGHR
ncbi:MAG: hypothetical protein QM831_33530 [Kofleriaceae bacterium]